MVSYIKGNKVEVEPNLLFDKFDQSSTHQQVYWGLRNFGPYEKNKPKLRIAIMSPSDRFIQTKQIILDLQSGNIPILPGGMKKFFRCDIEIAEEIQLPDIAIDTYKRKASEFVAAAKPSDVDLVLVFVPHTSEYILESPYYKVKGILASAGFVSQMVTENTFANLKWSYLNLASALFSKAGAIPWVLEDPMSNTDMILGISRSQILAPFESVSMTRRFVGHVNMFDNHGKWMAYESTAEPYDPKLKDDRLMKLREILSKAVSKFRALKKYDPKNIVLHNSKKFGHDERQTIIDALKSSLSDFNVAFVTIDESHPFRLYDMMTDDGSFPRGFYAYLGDNSILLSTTGKSEVAGRRMGTPKLLHVSLTQPLSRFITIEDVASQVLGLTKLDWATSMAFIREPVTVYFANQVAFLTGALSYSQWKSLNAPTINTILSSRPWFL
jgi:argonaute-like protein implicated in RNA metabolism and viral defense